jgi:hypothetical protein
MAIVKLFAERERERLGKGEPDILTYDLPKRLRVQLIHIWNEAIGHDRNRPPYDFSMPTVGEVAWPEVEKVLKKELGVLKLAQGPTSEDRVLSYFLQAQDLDALSVVEVLFVDIEQRIRRREVPDADSSLKRMPGFGKMPSDISTMRGRSCASTPCTRTIR